MNPISAVILDKYPLPAGFQKKTQHTGSLSGTNFSFPADSFAFNQATQPSTIGFRSGGLSPNFRAKKDEDNDHLIAFDEKIDTLTAEKAGLTEAGYGKKPDGWQAFWYDMDKGFNGVRSQLMGALRSQEWLNNLLPSVQNLRNRSTESGDRFTFTQGTETVVNLLGESVEIETPRFCFPKARSSDGIFRVSLLGDPGYSNATLDLNVAAMKALPKALGKDEDGTYQYDALLSMGDNLYGLKDKSKAKKDPINQSGHPDHLWNNIGKPYEAFFSDEVPFFSSLGNHEVKNGHQGIFLKYLDSPPFYRMSFGGNAQGDGACVEIFVINMTALTPLDAVKLQDEQADSVDDLEAEAKIQNAWLLSQLADSMKTNPKAKRLIVGHFPLFQQDKSVDMTYTKEFRYTLGLLYQNLLDQEIEVDGVRPIPVDMWLNGHVHKFTVHQSQQLLTDEGETFDLPAPLTQWSFGSSSHSEVLGLGEECFNDRAASEALWAHDSLGLDKMKIPCQHIGTGFSVMEIDPNNQEKPLTLGFVEPPMQPLKTTGKKQEGTFWRGQLVPAGVMTQKEAHPDTFKSIYSLNI